ncbi:hypothetical protein P153DRAFT_282765 [Dothidotthia symphoricarpi CBS 119687]|uniref:Uncharacterized protein n=1 Tax=Dothidotthia symphoricarpi CBS 119687 TaxID=1392245 RepID=A0A6A6AQY2_9PLEO|nr:uncharacterized protein P153DRAFT_282765 [Dothidotthia symphoricarpi CBS 119687]KAF2133364.1 hypothetical protein P153DRAFT_282765 [Dothidotthia symphoricarpi CBS 119687]
MDAVSPTTSSQSLASLPPIPQHIIVTFDGKVREMLRITRDADIEEQSSRRRVRPRYYAGI